MNRSPSSEIRARLTQAVTAPSSWWWLTTAGAAALILGLGFLSALQLFAWPLALLIFGLTIATALMPLVARLARWLPRIVAIILIYIILLLFFIGIGWLIFPPLVAQVQDAADRLPQLIEQARQRLDELSPWGNLDDMPLAETISAQLGDVSTYLVGLPLRFFASLFDLVVIIFISIYALIAAPATGKFVLSLFPYQTSQRVGSVLGDMSQAMGGYIRAIAIDGFIVGVLTYIGLTIIGVPYALALSLLAGLLEIIPFIGPLIGGVAIVSVALLQSPTTALIALIFVLVLQQVESNILIPNIMRSQTEISPLLTLLALVAGHSIGGLIGALVAVPLAAALRVFVYQVIAPAIRRWTGAAEEERQIEEDGRRKGDSDG